MDRPISRPVIQDPVVEKKETSEEATTSIPFETESDWEAAIAKAQELKAKAQQPTTEQVVTPPMAEPTVTPVAPKEEPTVDEVKRSKAKDASAIILTDIGTDEEYKLTFERILSEDERSEAEQEENPKQELIQLALCQQIGIRNKQQRLLTKLISSINKNTGKVSELVKMVKELGLSKVKPNISTSDGPKILTGDAALATVIARNKGVYRIPLYNSGFWVSVKPPTLSELDAFIREVDIEFKELGRILGAHYHLIFGIFIKQKLIDLLCNNIINSNFDNFKDRDALMSVISLNDYETIAWAFCCMLYSDGINIGLFCTNPECANRDNSQYIDLTKCNYLNHDVFNKDAITWMLEGFGPKTIRTAKDIAKYKQTILKATKVVTDKDGDNSYTLEVPSLDKYFSIGQSLLESIVNMVHGEKNTNNEQLSSQISYNIYKMLAPWISKLTMLDKGVTQFITSDTKAIMESLDIGYGESSHIWEEVEEFIKETKVSYFGATSLKCPKCGKVPNFTEDKMLLFDMEQLFFGLSYLQLGLIGTTP